MDTELVARLRAVIPRLARVLNDTTTGVGLTELTELEGLNPTMLSRVVKVLDERGLIRRMQDPGDLRAARVEVTPEGAKLHDQLRAKRTKLLSGCLQALPPDSAAMLLNAVPGLEALAEALKPLAKH
jgi:DNA-binding MarR family transcriptional regulator